MRDGRSRAGFVIGHVNLRDNYPWCAPPSLLLVFNLCHSPSLLSCPRCSFVDPLLTRLDVGDCFVQSYQLTALAPFSCYPNTPRSKFPTIFSHFHFENSEGLSHSLCLSLSLSPFALSRYCLVSLKDTCQVLSECGFRSVCSTETIYSHVLGKRNTPNTSPGFVLVFLLIF